MKRTTAGGIKVLGDTGYERDASGSLARRGSPVVLGEASGCSVTDLWTILWDGPHRRWSEAPVFMRIATGDLDSLLRTRL